MTIFVVTYPLVGYSSGQALKNFRREHDQAKASLIDPHFTIAFAITTFSYEDVLAQTRRIAKDFQPFEFLLSRLVPYTNVYTDESMLFLCPSTGENQLINIHRRFYEGEFQVAMQVDAAYEPHLTIALSDGPDNLVAAQTAASGLTLPIYGSIDTLSVIEIHDGEIIRSSDVLL